VISQGQVLFFGNPSTTSQTGAYIWSAGSLQVLADPGVSIPDRGSQKFNSLRYPSAHSGAFAFSSYDGIYVTVGGVLTKVMDPSSGFNGTSAPSVDGSTVWFFGERPGDGIFRWNNGVIGQVVGAGMPTPSAPGLQFTSLNSNVSAGNGSVAFRANSGTAPGMFGLSGIYTYTHASGIRQRIADQNTTVPGQSGKFTGFLNSPLSYDGQNLAFLGVDSNSTEGAYYFRNGVLTSLFRNGQAAPGGGTFIVGQSYTRFSVDGGNIALSNGLTSGSAIYYSFAGGPLQRLIGTGDMLFGKGVRDVQIRDRGLSGSEIAFWADFPDGSSGIYVANVPEPSSVTLFLACFAGCYCWFARQCPHAGGQAVRRPVIPGLIAR
jgi:hypothetical protein